MSPNSIAYTRAFEEYLRKGTPIPLVVKEAPTTTHYIWRTQGDSKVRSEHAANNGRIFSWDNPPPTGHPGEAFGCRCTAEPYEPIVGEWMVLEMDGFRDNGPKWRQTDFVRHYFGGNGKPVRVRDTGSLGNIVAAYNREVHDRLLAQIADAAREASSLSFSHFFKRPYNMTGQSFSIGDTVIGGSAQGTIRSITDSVLRIRGNLEFYLRDEFADPLDFQESIGLNFEVGTPYVIFDDWGGNFRGLIMRDRNFSLYRFDG